ncbi:MAG TPA: hypothetical protein PLT30_10550 [Deltaproteobacteria bacterium]|jgi:hypothetical protein|nr:hypothetical protein [Deltaproteobacteria bacterium]
MKPAALVFFFVAMLLCLCKPVYAAVIFQDNFDNAPSDARAGGVVPTGWDSWYVQGGAVSATFDSVTHYAGEISSPGRGGTGKSLKIWRHSTWPTYNSYHGALAYVFPTSSSYREIYLRYYMKLPSGMNINRFDNYVKLWRLNLSGGGELYLNIGTDTGTGTLQNSGFLHLLNASTFVQKLLTAGNVPWDSAYHCYEFHIKLNSTGNSDGVLEFWLDGVRKYSNTSFNFNASTSDRFVYLQHFSVGNRDDQSTSWQNSWQAFEFDDFVLSTTYVGPDGAAPAPAPSPMPTPDPTPTGTLFNEGFEDNSFASRGWFDDTSVDIDTSTKYSGTGSLRLTWAAGQTNPPLVAAMRKDFTPTDTLYISMYWRFNSNWVGSGVGYHPHLLYILSDLDDHWGGLAQNYLDTYIEVSNLTPRMIIQDGMNVNYSYGALPNNLTATTENRDVAGCNGCLAGSDCGDSAACYAVGGGTYWNGRFWNGSRNFNLNTWHKVEVYMKMNSISSGRAIADGIMWMKVDGNYVINKTKMVYRTNQRPTMKWRTLVIAPWIGDGSPQAQTMWIDNLTVATGASSDPNPPATPPSAPSGLRIIGN